METMTNNELFQKEFEEIKRSVHKKGAERIFMFQGQRPEPPAEVIEVV
jgi:hypothetical protein